MVGDEVIEALWTRVYPCPFFTWEDGLAQINEVAACTERWSRVRTYSDGQWRHCRSALQAALSVFPLQPLAWSDEACALVTDPLPGDGPDRLGLRVSELTMVLLDDREQPIKTMPMSGVSVSDAAQWLRSKGVDIAANATQTVPKVDTEVCTAFERWLGNGQSMLGHVARLTAGAASPRFNTATLEFVTDMVLPTRAGEPTRIVTMGLGWGADDGLPTIFVEAEPDSVGAGPWSLSIRQIDTQRDRDAQARAVQAFVTDAFGAAYVALDREWRARDSGPP